MTGPRPTAVLLRVPTTHVPKTHQQQKLLLLLVYCLLCCFCYLYLLETNHSATTSIGIYVSTVEAFYHYQYHSTTNNHHLSNSIVNHHYRRHHYHHRRIPFYRQQPFWSYTTTTTSCTYSKHSKVLNDIEDNKDNEDINEINTRINEYTNDLPLLTSTPIQASSSLVSPLIDPNSDIGRKICIDELHLSQNQYEQILLYIKLLLQWNGRINLLSRLNCTSSVIFTKHILPSLIGCHTMIHDRIVQQQQQQQQSDTTINNSNNNICIIDIGTGGGFPGIPLAIVYPNIQFVLADSIYKKIVAIQDMINILQITNHVSVYHGRIEDYYTTNTKTNKNNQLLCTKFPKFDFVIGRSVTELSKFCTWGQLVLKPNSGNLIYWTGGTINDEHIVSHIIDNISIEEKLTPHYIDNYDKRIITIPYSGVVAIATTAIESQQVSIQQQQPSTKKKLRRANSNDDIIGTKRNNQKRLNYKEDNNNDLAKGQWRKKQYDPNQPKQRGYENFQRYTSSSKSDKPTSVVRQTSSSDNIKDDSNNSV